MNDPRIPGQPADRAALEKAVEEARARLEQVRSAGAVARRRWKDEHSGGKPTEGELESLVKRVRAEAEELVEQQQRAKGRAKDRKREIAEWKTWFQDLPELSRAAQQPKLAAEIAWRAAEIGRLETEIALLDRKVWAAQGEVEMAQQRVEAARAGVYDLPADQDPRLLAVTEAEKAAEAALAAAEAVLQRVSAATPPAG